VNAKVATLEERIEPRHAQCEGALERLRPDMAGRDTEAAKRENRMSPTMAGMFGLVVTIPGVPIAVLQRPASAARPAPYPAVSCAAHRRRNRMLATPRKVLRQIIRSDLPRSAYLPGRGGSKAFLLPWSFLRVRR